MPSRPKTARSTEKSGNTSNTTSSASSEPSVRITIVGASSPLLRPLDINGSDFPKTSVVIPTLNEEKNLPLLLPRLPHWLHEIIIVDGRSTDRTVKVAKQINPDIKIVLQLRGGVRPEQMDEELMAKLKEAGAETMCVGIESAVWRIQKLIKKNLKIKKVEELLALAKKYRITTIGLMMMGFPGERIDEIKENTRWARSSQLDYTFFSIVTPFPSTELYDIATRKGYFAKHDDLENMNVMIPHMETSEVKSGRLKWLQIMGYLGFYLKPRRLVKLMSSAYIFKTFAGSLKDYVKIAASYYGRKLGNQPSIRTGSHG